MYKNKLKGYLLPLGFVVLYGSGFVFTQYGLDYASPMVFLFIRFLLASFILLLIVLIFDIKFNLDKKEFLHISISGLLTVGVFSIGVYLSIAKGITGSINALIISLQPILVSFLAIQFLNEKFSLKVFIGLLLGFIGVTFVVYQNISFDINSYLGLLYSFIALFGLTLGSIYQKKFCSSMNLYIGGFIQTLACSIFTVPFLFFEDIYIDFSKEFLIAILYMSIGVSIGALSLLYLMIKSHDVSKVSSIFYVIPLSTAIISFFLLKESLYISLILGIFFVLCAIILINKKEKDIKLV